MALNRTRPMMLIVNLMPVLLALVQVWQYISALFSWGRIINGYCPAVRGVTLIF
jgi:hypothetical protein